MYIDRHDAPGISAEEVAQAHYRDLEIQEDYGVRYHTYWFDPAEEAVFCLAEGPTKEALEDVHRNAHGLVANTILELAQGTPLNAFFGSLPRHAPQEPYTASAVRAIVFTDICGSVEQTHLIGDEAHMRMLAEHNQIVRDALVRYEGREVKHTGDGIMAAFTSVTSAVGFAVQVQQALRDRNEGEALSLEVSIGISAGEPVTDDNDDLFGATVQLSARLCALAGSGEILVSVAVRELCIGKRFQFEDRGRVRIKGLPDPAQTYAVSWRTGEGLSPASV